MSPALLQGFGEACRLVGLPLFAEVLVPWAWLGAAIIVASSVYIANREIRAAKA